MAIQTSDNKWAVAKYIIDATPGQGTFTTFADAVAGMSSGDVCAVRQGNYVEDFTVDKENLTFCSLGGDNVGSVKLTGKITFNIEGNLSLVNLNLTTNGDHVLSYGGSGAGNIYIDSCNIRMSDHAGIEYTNSVGNSSIKFMNTTATSTGNFPLFEGSGAGSLQFYDTTVDNAGSTTVNSTISSGTVNFFNSNFRMPLTTSGTAGILADNSTFWTFTNNQTCLTIGGSGTATIRNSQFRTGTATAITVNSNLGLYLCDIQSSNAAAIDGSGTLTHEGITFSGSSSNITTSTNTVIPWPVNQGGTGADTLTDHGVLVGSGTSPLTALSVGSTGTVLAGVTGADPAFTAYPQATGLGLGASPGASTGLTFDGTNFMNAYSIGTWTPSLEFGGGTTGITYSLQQGGYIKIGRLVMVSFSMILTSKGTDTGNANIAGLPFNPSGALQATYGTCLNLSMTLTGFVGVVVQSRAGTDELFTKGLSLTTSAALTDANYGNGSQLFGSITYFSTS